jgi:hypothetical protein
MGFEFVFMSLEFDEDIGYVMKQIDRCCFPITKKAVNEGGIEILIKCIRFRLKLHYDIDAEHQCQSKLKYLFGHKTIAKMLF